MRSLMEYGAAISVLLPLAACLGPQERVPLPVPIMPVNGATPVPGNSAAFSTEIGTAVRGPELARGETRSVAFGAGAGNRFSVWLGFPQARNRLQGTVRYAGVHQLRTKMLIGRPLGGRGVLSAYGDTPGETGSPPV